MSKIIEGPIEVVRVDELTDVELAEIRSMKLLTDLISKTKSGKVFVPALEAVLIHNNFADKQGGTTGEYYHLTADELTGLTTAIHTDVADEINGLTEKVTPASGDMIVIEDNAAAGVKKKVDIDNIGGGGGGGSAFMFVAAFDATTKEKDGADYVCDGTNDEVQLAAAQTALGNEGKIFLSSGAFNIDAEYQCSVDLQGVGRKSPTTGTIINVNAVNALKLVASRLTLSDFYITSTATAIYSNSAKTSLIFKNIVADVINFFNQSGSTSTFISFENCEILGDGTGFAFRTLTGRSINVSNCYIDNFLRGIVFSGNTNELKVTNNTFNNCDLPIERTANQNIIIGNVISGTSGTRGLLIIADTGDAFRNIISNNIITGYTTGIQLQPNAFNNIISNNHFDTCTTGINILAGAKGNNITGNEISNATTGIADEGNNNNIQSNIIADTISGTAIALGTSSDWEYVVNNITIFSSLTSNITDAGTGGNNIITPNR